MIMEDTGGKQGEEMGKGAAKEKMVERVGGIS
jgi:hypothetical protein